MHGLAVYVKEVLPFTWDLYLYKTMDSQCHFLLLITFFAFAYDFLFYFHLTFSISSMHRWGSLNQPIYQCVCFWWINIHHKDQLNIHHKDWLAYSGGTDRLGELCYNFIANDFTHMVNFPTQIPYCDSHWPSLLDLFVGLSDASICSATTFPPLGNSDLLSEFPSASHQTQNEMSYFIV